jgi:hypothetical protein
MNEPAPNANNYLLDYDKMLLDTLMKLEERITKFSIQDYVASGAVFLTLFTTRFPVWIVTPVILLIWVNFTLAMVACFCRHRVLFEMHRITRNCWFEEKSKADFSLSSKNTGT